jgi:hypothetical protein
MKRSVGFSLVATLSLFACGSDKRAGDDTAAPDTTSEVTQDTSPLPDVAPDMSPDISSDGVPDAPPSDAAEDATPEDVADDSSGLDAIEDTTPEVRCDRTGFAPVSQFLVPAPFFSFQYLALSSLDVPMDIIRMDALELTAGQEVYVLENPESAQCTLCVSAGEGCSEGGAECDKRFAARSGSVRIVRSESNQRVTGTFEDVILGEVDLEQTDMPRFVPDGETWCLDGFAFDAKYE